MSIKIKKDFGYGQEQEVDVEIHHLIIKNDRLICNCKCYLSPKAEGAKELLDKNVQLSLSDIFTETQITKMYENIEAGILAKYQGA